MADQQGRELDQQPTQEARDEMETFNIRPSLHLMAVCACYTFDHTKNALFNALYLFYKCVIVLLLFAFTARFIYFTIYHGTSIIKDLAYYLLLLQCVCCYIICCKLFSVKHGHFQEALEMWQNCLLKLMDQDISVDFRYMRRMQAVILSIAVTLLIICFVSQFTVSFVLIPPAEAFELVFNESFTAPLEDTVYSRVLLTLPLCIQIAIIIVPPSFLMIISLMLRTGFRALNMHLKDLIKAKDKSHVSLESYRQIHIDLCNVVSTFDQDLSFLYGNVYFWTLGLGIYLLYFIVSFQQGLVEVILGVYFLILTLMMLFATSISAAYVHGEELVDETCDSNAIESKRLVMEHSKIHVDELTMVDNRNNCASPKTPTVHEDEANRNSRELNLILRPILFCMGLAGCYSFQQPKGKLLAAFMWINKFMVLSSAFLWMSRFFALMDSWPSLAIYITINMISLECAANVLICWKSFSTTHGSFQICINKLHNILAEMKGSSISVDYNYIHRRQLLCVAALVVFVLSDLAIQALTSFIFIPDPEDFNTYGINATSSVTFPLEDTPFTRFVLLIPIYFIAISLVTPPFYLTVINTVILALLNALNVRIDDKLLKHDGNLDDVEMFRKFHVKITAIIAHFDKDFRYLYGNIFFLTLCQAILSVYILTKYEQHNILVLSIVYMLCLTLVILLIMTISAALVHEAAHAALDTIYYVNVETISLEKATQLNLFLSKLTGTQVGFTTFGLLTITKEFILTIAGVFLTYFAVLYTTL